MPSSRLARALRGAALAGSLLAIAGTLFLLARVLLPSSNDRRVPLDGALVLRSALLYGAMGATYGAVYGSLVSASVTRQRSRGIGAVAGVVGGIVLLALGGILPELSSALAWGLFAVFVATTAGLGAWCAPRMQAMLVEPRERAA